jgi:hypothetical protein
VTSRRTLALSGLLAAVGLTPLVATPAQAASCVTYSVSDNHRAVVVRNTCSDTRRIKVIWHHATDSACTQVKARTGEFIDSRGWPASFDRLVTC